MFSDLLLGAFFAVFLGSTFVFESGLTDEVAVVFIKLAVAFTRLICNDKSSFVSLSSSDDDICLCNLIVLGVVLGASI